MRNGSFENFHKISNRIPGIVSYESCRPTACNFNKRGHDHWCFLKYFIKIFIAYILYCVSEHLKSCFFIFDICDLCAAHWRWKHGFTLDIKGKKRYLPCFHSSCRIKTDKWSLILCHKCQFNQEERVRWEVRNKKIKPYLDVIIILFNGLTFWFEMNKQEILLIMKHGYPVFFGCSLRWEKLTLEPI